MTGHEPPFWCVVFNVEGASGWASWVPGRFKHVRAYGFIPKTRLWLFYDVSFSGTKLMAIPDGPDAKAAIWSFIGPPGKSCIIGLAKLPQRKRGFPWSNWCTSALRHLLNLPGRALRPDAFYRDCLDNGGMPFEADDGRTAVPGPTP